MRKRIIHYDLNTKLSEPSYPDLYAVLKELNSEAITESVCWINTELNEEEICKKIGSVIHKTDKVYFISVTGNTKELFCKEIKSIK